MILRVPSTAARTRGSTKSNARLIAPKEPAEKNASKIKMAHATTRRTRIDNIVCKTDARTAKKCRDEPSRPFPSSAPFHRTYYLLSASVRGAHPARFNAIYLVQGVPFSGRHFARKEQGEQAAILILTKNFEHHVFALPEI
jgi:hypothetical protein